MPNFKLDISYEGTNFFGWQIQKNDRSVQGDITYALSKILSAENINLIGSGRTDSGVHANQQIANFKFDTSIKPKDIKNAINSHLKNDVYINSCECVSDTFNSSIFLNRDEFETVLWKYMKNDYINYDENGEKYHILYKYGHFKNWDYGNITNFDNFFENNINDHGEINIKMKQNFNKFKCIC